MVLHVCTSNYFFILPSFAKLSPRDLVLFNKNNFPTKILKGHNSIKNEEGVTILNLCTSPDGALYL